MAFDGNFLSKKKGNFLFADIITNFPKKANRAPFEKSLRLTEARLDFFPIRRAIRF